MTVWYKQGVIGDLQPVARKGLGKIADSAPAEIFVTSLRDGNHRPGSLHYDGLAFDIKDIKGFSINKIKSILGPDWDIIDEGNHIHCEYDPK